RTPPRSPRAPAAPPGRSPPRPSGKCRPGSTPCRPGAQPPAAALAHVSSTSAPLTADCLDPTLGRAASPRSQIRGGTPSRPDRAGTATSPAGAEDVGEVEAYRLLELIVGAAARVTVGTPADELDGVAESGAFHVVVPHLDHALRAERGEGEVLVGVPPARLVLAGSAFALLMGGPVPRVALEGRHQRLQLLEERDPGGHRERADHPDRGEYAAVVVQAEQQRADPVRAGGVHPVPGD